MSSRGWMGLAGVWVAVAAGYARVLGSPFWADDYRWLGRCVAALRDWSLPFTAVFGRDYNPLTYLGFAFNFLVAGQDARVWHGVDLLLHLGCTALVFALARRMSQSLPVAVGASLGFGLHVAISEPVIWSSARVHSQALLFVLAAILVAEARGAWPSVGLHAALFLVALNFKETAIAYLAVPPLYALGCRWRGLTVPPRTMSRTLALLGVAAVWLAVRVALLPVDAAARSLGFVDARVAAGKLALTIAALPGVDLIIPDHWFWMLLPPALLAATVLLSRDRMILFGVVYAFVMSSAYLAAPKHSSRYAYVPWPGLVLVAARVVQLVWRRLDVRWGRGAMVMGLGVGLLWSALAIQIEIDDYRLLGRTCTEQMEELRPAAEELERRFREGAPEVVVFVDRSPTSPLQKVVLRLRGRPKLVAYRKNGVAGIIPFADLVNLHVYGRRTLFVDEVSVHEAEDFLGAQPPDDSVLFMDYDGTAVRFSAGRVRRAAELWSRSPRRVTVARLVPFGDA